MPKRYSSDEVIKALRRQGFVVVSQKGSHLKMKKSASQTKIVTIPAHRKQLPIGTFISILKQAGIEKSDIL